MSAMGGKQTNAWLINDWVASVSSGWKPDITESLIKVAAVPCWKPLISLLEDVRNLGAVPGAWPSKAWETAAALLAGDNVGEANL
jgi:hypothetical protein